MTTHSFIWIQFELWQVSIWVKSEVEFIIIIGNEPKFEEVGLVQLYIYVQWNVASKATSTTQFGLLLTSMNRNISAFQLIQLTLNLGV